MKKKNFEILICGSGMIGMTFALMMAQKRIKVCLIDKNSYNSFKEKKDSRTTAISQGSSRIFNRLSLWQDLERQSQPIYKILVGDGINNENLIFDHDKLKEGPLGYIIDNSFFKRRLFEEVVSSKFIRFYSNTEIKEINNDDLDNSFVDTNKGKIGFKLLVAADGRFSKTRFHANIKYRFHDYKQNAFVFNISHQKSHKGIALERFFSTGPMAILPMKTRNSNHSSVVWTVESKISDSENFRKNFRDEFIRKYSNFFGKIDSLSSVKEYPLNVFSCNEFSNKNVVLIGDACQAIHPIAGQGFNLGLRDAKCLSNLIYEFYELGIEPFNNALLKLYEKNRFIDKNILVGATHYLNKLFSNTNRVSQSFRRLGLQLFSKSDFFKNQSMIFAMGLKNPEI
tara:strand:- start:615 stop:1805 length:1191 start_codon:yes stop_codon:yes gene_type:complete